MGVKGTCRSANGGGVPFCMLAIYQTGIHSLLLTDSSGTPQGQKGTESGQKVAKVNNFLGVLGVFSGKSETKRGKSEIYFGFEASVVALHLWRWWCPPSAGGALLLLLFGCVPSLSPCLCPLSCFACRVACEYGFISRFKGVLEGFGVRMCIYMG